MKIRILILIFVAVALPFTSVMQSEETYTPEKQLKHEKSAPKPNRAVSGKA